MHNKAVFEFLMVVIGVAIGNWVSNRIEDHFYNTTA